MELHVSGFPVDCFGFDTARELSTAAVAGKWRNRVILMTALPTCGKKHISRATIIRNG
jgi:hypothetical protein